MTPEKMTTLKLIYSKFKGSALSTIAAIIIIGGISVSLSSCVSEDSATVDQDRIHTTFEVFYDFNTDITYARAQFRLGNALGTTLKLSSPSQVTFNAQPLTFNETLAYYEKQFPGFLNGGEFKYTDAKSKVITNSINGLLKPTIPSSFIEVDRSVANTFAWTGAALADREVIVLDIYNTGQTNFQLFTQISVGATTIILPVTQLANLASGTNNATAVLDWSRTDNLTQSTSAGGYIKVSSRDKTKAISVKN